MPFPRIKLRVSCPRPWALALAALLFGCSDSTPLQRTNLLIVTLDTTRVDALGCYGGPQGVSPTIDEFARTGVRFDRAYTSAPLTLPAHSSLMTGRYPDEHGVRANNSYALPAEELTLAEILQEEGYSTAAFVSSFVLDSQYGLAQGFGTYSDQMPESDVSRVAERPADEVMDELLDWLAARDAKAPFFAWLHCYDPHFPHELPAGQAAQFESPYHDEVAFVDGQLARVRKQLQSTDELANTLIVIAADHGEGQGEHGESTHGYFLYQSTQHIPLILSHPQLAPGKLDSRNASLVDILPTALAFLGIEPPKTSGVNLLGENQHDSRSLYMEAELGRIDFGLSPMVGVVDENHKLIGTPSPELYDLMQDSAELNNLRGELAERAQELNQWISKRQSGQRADATHQADAAATERLRGLGYTGGSSDLQDAREDWTSAQLLRWSQLSNAGLRHYQAGDLPEAIAALRPLVQECPEAFSAQLFLGLGLVNTGEVDQGLLHLEKAVALQPDGSADAWWNIAVGRARSKQMAKAEQALLRVIAIEPGHLRALQKLAELRLQATDRAGASTYLKSLIKHAPESPEGRWAAAQLRRLRG